MIEAVGPVLPQAVAIAISPIPIALVILVLVSARARTSGPAFAAGWVVAVATVSGLAAAVAGGAGTGDDGAVDDGAHVLQLLLGLALAVLAVRQWRSRPRAGEAAPRPKLFAAVDGLTVPRAAGVGFLAGGVNPKNLALAVSAGVTIAQAGTSAGNAVAAVLIFTVMASLTVVTPVVAALLLGERARPALDATKDWLVANNTTILVVLFTILAAKLIGQGLGVFA